MRWLDSDRGRGGSLRSLGGDKIQEGRLRRLGVTEGEKLRRLEGDRKRRGGLKRMGEATQGRERNLRLEGHRGRGG